MTLIENKPLRHVCVLGFRTTDTAIGVARLDQNTSGQGSMSLDELPGKENNHTNSSDA